MTLTGFNADHRLQIRPSMMAGLAFALVRCLNESHSLSLPSGVKAEDLKPFALDPMARSLGIEPSILRMLAADLARAGKSALIVAGPALPPEAHIACNLLHIMLGAEGNTVDMAIPWRLRPTRQSGPGAPAIFPRSDAPQQGLARRGNR